MIARSDYIQQLRPFIDKPQIKIITGIRRSGKSTVLHLLKDELLNNGVQEVENWKTAKLTLLPKSRAIKYISRLLIN